MHETGIAAELLRMASEQAGLHGGAPVSRVAVRVGSISGVVVEALAFAFEAIRAEFPLAREAKLEVEYVPLKASCTKCNLECTPEADLVLWCAQCGAPLDIMQGKELDLVWVELEDREGAECSESP